MQQGGRPANSDPPTPSFPDTFGTYVHAIDDYYANHPDKSSTVPEYVMSCSAMNPPDFCKINGDR
jgi:hypothetical protein